MRLRERLKDHIMPMTSEAREKLRLCYVIAKNSPDLSCKNGSVIYTSEGVEVSRAYNKLPEGVEVTQERLTQRPKKYFYVIHAERSAAMNAMKKQGIVLKGSVAQQLKLAFLESRTKRFSTALKDCQSPDYSFGVLLSGRIAAVETKRLLEALFILPENSTVEWMFHPGYPFADDEPAFTREFGRFFLKSTRDRERVALQSPEIRGILQEHRQQLISYREL